MKTNKLTDLTDPELIIEKKREKVLAFHILL
jgi:hypothetical protein